MGTLRIVAGEFGGRRIRAPRGRAVRPTSERVREALFDILGGAVDGLAVLDLFAGSGALGLEALSRGARRVTLVEADRAVLRLLRDNVERLEAGGRCRIVSGTPVGLLGSTRLGGPFELVLADPPYRLPERPLLAALGSSRCLAPAARIVLERPAATARPEAAGLGVTFLRSATYGRARLDFYRRAAPGAGFGGTG